MDKRVPEVRFKGFTDDWEQQHIGNLLKNLYNGQTPSRSNNINWNGNINWLSSGELNKGIVTKTIEKITPEGKSAANLKIVSSGTFVMAITGLEAKGTRGNCAILGIDTTLNQSCMALFPDESKLIPKFLFQWYIKFGNEYGIRYTQGTKQQSYNAELIKILPINNPNIEEQEVLVSFLKKLDDIIQIKNQQLSLYESLKNYLLQSLFPSRGEFTPKVRFTDFKNAWQKSRAEYLFHPIAKKGFKDLPVLSVTQENGIIKRSDLSIDIKYNKSSLSNYKLVEPSNFVISLRSFQGGFELSNTSGIVSPAYTVFSFKEKTDNSDLFWKEKFKSYGFIQSLKAITFGIRDGKSISFSEFKSMSLIYTQNRIEQDKIGNILMSIDNLISKQRIEINYLEKMKNYYLQKLFI